MSWNKQVFSSMITNVGFDDENNELLVTFTNGKTCAYQNATEELALDLSRAPSVGEMFNAQVKGQFPFRYT